MKIFCFRYPRNTVTDILICLLCIVVISLILMNGESITVSSDNCTNDVLQFIENYGWIVDPESITVESVDIPMLSDDTNEEYFLLQESQGFDFKAYTGMTVKRYTLRILNYPQYENADNIYVNIFMYDNKIVGGDICCVSVNGFITGVVQNVKDST